MSPLDTRHQSALDAAMARIKATAEEAAAQVSDRTASALPSTLKIVDRDTMLSAQIDLKRNALTFSITFGSALRDKIDEELKPRNDTRRSLAATNWQSLSLVDDKQVEAEMAYTRIGQMISHACEWELRELAAHMGTLLNFGRADEERNPLRAEIVGMALVRAIEAVTESEDARRMLGQDIGRTLSVAMPLCYKTIIGDLQARGVRAVELSVRGVDGPGHQLPGLHSGYAPLARESGHSSGFGDLTGSGVDAGDSQLGAPRSTRSGSAPNTTGGYGSSRHGGSSTLARQGVSAQADQQLMTLLRRLTSLASRPGAFDSQPMSGGAYAGSDLAQLTSRLGGALDAVQGASAPLPQPGASGEAVAVNLIRAHREELMQASPGRLDHMVIEVVGSLFDQILSDTRVPPQMARQIARLQLPVLRVAMNDPSFFSSRRHPVRRFVNRIASLACAFDEFDAGPGKPFLARVRELVQEIVEGDFDQVDLYDAKLAELEEFTAEQGAGEVQRSGTSGTLENKESDLRIQQRYMLQLQSSLTPIALPPYLREFVAQVWSQALVLAARREGPGSERGTRYRRAGRDLLMSVQPKGSPPLRQKFLMQLPGLMKDLKDGMQFIGWPDAAQKDFFGKLLPAHSESLKAPPMSELDHNMLAKQLEGIFNTPVPGVEGLSYADVVPEVDAATIERRFTPEEAKQVGLVQESAVDWSVPVDIDLNEEPELPPDTGPDTLPGQLQQEGIGIDLNLDMASSEPPEPSRGAQLMDHVKIGYAYQMHLKDEWQKVRLTYLSPGRSFFVFSRGTRHQETISMTARMLSRMCETGRMRAFESAYLLERATHRARKQLAALKAPSRQ